MNLVLALEQTLNGLQLGVMLFLMAAGLTLIFGIMNLVNLAHGSLYMVGAYLATYFYQVTGSYLLGVLLGLAGTLVVGIAVEVLPAHALRARAPRPGSRHFWPDPLLQRADGDPLGPGGDLHDSSRLPERARGTFRGLALPALPPGDHRRRPRGGGPAVVRGRAHAPGDADSRRGFQPRHGRGARRKRPPAVYARVRLRRCASGPRGPYVGTHPRGAAGDG